MRKNIQRVVCLAVATVMFFGPSVASANCSVAGDAACYQEIQNAITNVNQYKGQVASYQYQISALNARVLQLQRDIADTDVLLTEVQKKIEQLNLQIAVQKKILGALIQKVDAEDRITKVEMLASADNFLDYINRSSYLNEVQKQTDEALRAIKNLKTEALERQKELTELRAKQVAQKGSLDSQLNEQRRLLSMSQGQVQNFTKELSALQAQQVQANRSLGGQAVPGDPNHGNYPKQYDYPHPRDSIVDIWRMLNRECVSYTAWKVDQTFGSGHMPRDWDRRGNANQWPSSARAAGIPTGGTPRAHSVAISMSGYYGHSMWVEYLLPGGRIHVSQYNYGLQGEYSEMNISAAGLTYIYFK